MKNLCASCNTDQQVKFYEKGKTQFGTFNIGWSLCADCYETEVSLEHDRQEKMISREQFENLMVAVAKQK